MLAVIAIGLGMFWFGIMVGTNKSRSDLITHLTRQADKAVKEQRFDEALLYRRCINKMVGL